MALSGPFSLSMALNSNPFVEGIDPTSTFGGYASVLLQLIRQAQPSSTYGMILFDSATPDVSGSNAWRKRCVWLDQTSPSAPVLKMYRASGSPGWVSVLSLIPSNTITTAMIQDAAVTLAKLSAAGGTAGQVIRINAGATAFEFVNPSSLFGPSTIPVSRLDVSGFSPGMFRVAGGEYGGGGGLWYSVDTVLNAAGVACLPANALVTPGAYTGDKALFLAANATATEASFRAFNPDDDIDDDALNGAKLQDATVKLNKLNQSSATVGQYIAWDGAEWVATTPAAAVSFYTGTGNVPTSGGLASATSFTHGLGAKPRIVYARLKCVTPEYNYAAGDYIDLNQVYTTNGIPVFYVMVTDATTVKVVCGAGIFPGFAYVIDRSTGAYNNAITAANWQVEVNCIK